MIILGWVFLAITAGVAVALQAQVMGEVSEQLGWMANVLVAYIIGLVLILILILVSVGIKTLSGEKFSWSALFGLSSWYQLSVGVYGVIIVGSIGVCSYRLGLVPTLVIVFVSQVTMGKLISQFGLMGVTQRSLSLGEGMGLLLLMAGTLVLLVNR